MRIPPQSSLLLRYFQQKCSSSKLRFSPQSSQLSWGRFHRSQSERGCLQWKPLTETENKHKRLGNPPCMKKTMSSVSSTEFSSTKVLKFLHLMEKKNLNQDWKEPSERVWPVARLPNGLVVIEPGVLVHRLVVQELLCHLPWIVEWYQNHMDIMWHKHFMHTLSWTRWTCKSQQMSSWGGPRQCWLTFGHLTNKV